MIALLVVFSMVVAEPCAAIQAEGAGEATNKQPHAVAAPAPSSPADAAHQIQLKSFLAPDFPCSLISFVPILVDLCHALFPPPLAPSPPDPTECRSSLTKSFMPPCAAFLTNSSVSAPSSDCCNGIDWFYDDDSTTPFSHCHVANGDIGELLPAPVTNQTRNVDALVACIHLTRQTITGFCDKRGSTYSKHICMQFFSYWLLHAPVVCFFNKETCVYYLNAYRLHQTNRENGATDWSSTTGTWEKGLEWYMFLFDQVTTISFWWASELATKMFFVFSLFLQQDCHK
jgi:hypothetical protein